MTPERFVSAAKAADLLDISRRYLLSLARKGIPGAYPLDPQAQRKVWRFRLSELAAAISGIRSSEPIQSETNRDRIRSAVSRA